jgi:hypothetical protein
MKHPEHTYGGFVPAISEWGMTGPDLRSLGMSLRSDSLFQASSWVAFCGCSLKLTNGGCQC